MKHIISSNKYIMLTVWLERKKQQAVKTYNNSDRSTK